MSVALAPVTPAHRDDMGQPEKLSDAWTQRRATRPRTRAIPRSTSTGSGGAMTPIRLDDRSRGDPRLHRKGKGKEAKLAYLGHGCWTIDRGSRQRLRWSAPGFLDVV